MPTWPRFDRQRWCCSTGCSSCSTPRTAACCRSTTLRYDDYGLRKKVRDDIARRIAQGDAFSAHATSYYDHVITLGKLIDAGDASIGLPPYNGGLFAPTAAPLLEASRLPDAAFAPIVHDLSHTETAGARGFVNYRDMSVQQLGSIYERLLEREPVRDARGEIDIRPNPYARKDSGSFYTPQELVDLIVDQTLKPLVEERLQAFEDKARELASDRRPKHQRRDELQRLDPAEAVLELKVLDPAMGSGHFPRHRRGLPGRLHRRSGGVRPGRSGVAGRRRRLRVAAGGARGNHSARHSATGA